MLVLSRKKNESIVINGNITVFIVEVRGDKVRLGISAPKDVPVHRKEIWDAICAAKEDEVNRQAGVGPDTSTGSTTVPNSDHPLTNGGPFPPSYEPVGF